MKKTVLKAAATLASLVLLSGCLGTGTKTPATPDDSNIPGSPQIDVNNAAGTDTQAQPTPTEETTPSETMGTTTDDTGATTTDTATEEGADTSDATATGAVTETTPSTPAE